MHELELETKLLILFYRPVFFLSLRKDYFLVLALGEGQWLELETFYPLGEDSLALTALLPSHGPTMAYPSLTQWIDQAQIP